MPITSTAFQTIYTADGSAGPWGFTWVYTEDQMIEVYVDGVLKSESTYTLVRDYTSTGGSITFLGGHIPTLGQEILIQRVSDLLQQNSFKQNTQLPPTTLVEMFDKLTIIAQQLSARLDRAFAFPLTIIGFDSELPNPVAGSLFAINNSNDGIDLIEPPVAAGLALVSQGIGVKPAFLPVASVSGGDVVGPNGAVADNIATFNGATGKVVKDSGVSTANIANAVQGPGVATDNALALFDGTTGKLIKNGLAPSVNGQFVTVTAGAFALAAAPAPTVFESSDQSITAAGALTIAHGLGIVPRIVRVLYRCVIAELGYSVGARVYEGAVFLEPGANDTQASVRADATNVYVRFPSGGGLCLVHNTTGVYTFAVLANWRLRVLAF